MPNEYLFYFLFLVDENIYELKGGNIPKTPASLSESLAALEDDHAYLLRGDVFTPDVIESWINYKRVEEVDALRLRPHPYEFCMYYDV